MSEFNQKIKVNDEKYVEYSIYPGFVPMHTITAADRKETTKIMKFHSWDDYSFDSWYAEDFEEYKKSSIQSHTFEKEHPLYIPLLHLLNGEEELIIDDDETAELNQKYMRIFLDGDNIGIDFINHLEKDSSPEKFKVFIKNILRDYRSKIDCFEKDTKERLYFFFEEAYERMKEEEHQISIEEYLINHNLLSKEESKKYIKKFDFKM